jgi:uncharacterized protein YfkK (UPF0435 family)
MPFNINIKSADEKRIDEICLSLQGNSLQLDLLTELYDLFIKEENLSGKVVVREGRFSALTKIFPFVTDLMTKEIYISTEYFESWERHDLEELLVKIRMTKALNPQKNYSRIVDHAIRYQKVIDAFTDELQILNNQIKNHIGFEDDLYEILRDHLKLAVKYLNKASVHVDYLKIAWFKEDYEKQVEALADFF